MGELINNLGIDVRLLLAQVLNFFILFFILRKFLFRPVLSKLDERRAREEGNIEKEKSLSTQLASLEIEEERTLAEARTQSNIILEEARKKASVVEESILEEAREKAQALIEKTEKELLERRAQFDRELVAHAGTLITESIEKALPRVLDDTTNEKLAHESLKEFVPLSSRT